MGQFFVSRRSPSRSGSCGEMSVSSQGKSWRDLSYREDSSPEQRVDIFLPGGKGPHPAIFWIHGGGWHSGSKEIDFAKPYLDRGIALVSIGYRLSSGGHPFPAQIEDCVAACAWVQNHAAEWSLDASRLGVLGHSAGGHLAALLALASVGAAPFSVPDIQPLSGAVIWSGPLNLGREAGGWPSSMFPWNPDDLFCRTFFPGGEYDEAFGLRASASSYLGSAMPPTLVIHGEADSVVPWQQASRFADDLQKLGVDATFELLPTEGHDIISEERHRQAALFFLETWAQATGTAQKMSHPRTS